MSKRYQIWFGNSGPAGTFVKTQKTENSNHGFELYRPSSKGTRLLLQVIKAIINQCKAMSTFSTFFARPWAHVSSLPFAVWVATHFAATGNFGSHYCYTLAIAAMATCTTFLALQRRHMLGTFAAWNGLGFATLRRLLETFLAAPSYRHWSATWDLRVACRLA